MTPNSNNGGKALQEFMRADFPGLQMTTALYQPLPNAKPHYCFSNVSALVEERGGKLVLGWGFEFRNGFIIAVHHAVWEYGGRLIDITPVNATKDCKTTAVGEAVPFLVDSSATLYKRFGDTMGIARPSKFWIVKSDRKTQATVSRLMEVERWYQRYYNGQTGFH